MKIQFCVVKKVFQKLQIVKMVIKALPFFLIMLPLHFALNVWLDAPDYVYLLAGSVTVVFFIVFEKDITKSIAPKQLENDKDSDYLVGEYIYPFIFVSFILHENSQYKLLLDVVMEKSSLIVLIMCFSFAAHGLKKSLYFDRAAYKIAQTSQGSLSKMVLWVAIVASIVTYFTSNDIVVLTLTPIIMRVYAYARIRDAEIMLVTLFIAANTLSMGMLVGSPTNIIYGQENSIGSVDYFVLMLVPSLLALLTTYVAISFLVKKTESKKDRYIVPSLVYNIEKNSRMTLWMLYFFFLVILVTIITTQDRSLWWFCVPGLIIPVFLSHWHNKSLRNDESRGKTSAISGSRSTQDIPEEGYVHRSKKNDMILSEMLNDLPWGIVIFAFAFFFTAELIYQDIHFEKVARSLIASANEMNAFLGLLFSILASGILVNIINDLPAASLLSTTVSGLSDSLQLDTFISQGILIGLNIGCYVTPIGALAGIIWFQIINKEKKHLVRDGWYSSIDDLKTPTRGRIFLYGSVIFVFTSFFLSIQMVIAYKLHKYLLNNELISIGISGLLSISCIAFFIFAFITNIRKANIYLPNIQVLLGFSSWISTKTSRKVMMRITVPLIFLGISSLLVYYFEMNFLSKNAMVYEYSPVSDGVGKYIKWIIILFGSGHTYRDLWPANNLSSYISGLLPLLVLIFIVLVYRALEFRQKRLDNNVLNAIARGLGTPVTRYVFFPYNDDMSATTILEHCIVKHGGAYFLLFPTTKLDSAVDDLSSKVDEKHRVNVSFQQAFNFNDSDPDLILNRFQNLNIFTADNIFILPNDAEKHDQSDSNINFVKNSLLHLQSGIESKFADNLNYICNATTQEVKNNNTLPFDVEVHKYGRVPTIFVFENHYKEIENDIEPWFRLFLRRIECNCENYKENLIKFFEGSDDPWHTSYIYRREVNQDVLRSLSNAIEKKDLVMTRY